MRLTAIAAYGALILAVAGVLTARFLRIVVAPKIDVTGMVDDALRDPGAVMRLAADCHHYELLAIDLIRHRTGSRSRRHLNFSNLLACRFVERPEFSSWFTQAA